MKAINIILIVLFNFIFQTTIIHYFSFWGVIPNTTLIILVCFSLLRGRKKGAALGLFIGLIQDILFARIIGFNALIYFIVGLTVGTFDDKVFKENSLISVVFVSLSTITYHILYFLFMYFNTINVNIFSLFNKIVLIEVIYNSLLSIIIYKQISKLYKNPYMSFSNTRR